MTTPSHSVRPGAGGGADPNGLSHAVSSAAGSVRSQLWRDRDERLNSLRQERRCGGRRCFAAAVVWDQVRTRPDEPRESSSALVHPPGLRAKGRGGVRSLLLHTSLLVHISSRLSSRRRFRSVTHLKQSVSIIHKQQTRWFLLTAIRYSPVFNPTANGNKNIIVVCVFFLYFLTTCSCSPPLNHVKTEPPGDCGGGIRNTVKIEVLCR